MGIEEQRRRAVGRARAGEDFKEEGLGQDANPFDREKDFAAWDAYAWRMHELWSADFSAAMAEQKEERRRQRCRQ